MSNRYEASGAIGSAPAAGAPFFELRNGSTRRILVEEIGVTLGAATASRFALVRASAQGAGGTAVVGQAEDPAAPAGTASLVSATFTTAPTNAGASVYLRRANLAAAIGAGIVWQWPGTDRLIVPPSSSLLLVAIAASAATIDAWAVWTE